MPLSRRVRVLSCVALAALACGVASCWVIPWRLGCGANGSYYTFGLVGDEYTYAQRIQPLVSGATATNPINGVCDPAAISEYYLEDACRLFLTLTGFDVIPFVWAWRVLFPVALAGALAALACVCLRRKRAWTGPLRLAAGAAAFALFYAGYDLVTGYPPLQGWLHRFPTNLEYPLSVLAALLYIRFLEAPSAWRGAALSLSGAALIYLRPYLAIPWGLALGSGLAWLTVSRGISLRVALAILATLLAALAPWLAVRYWNAGTEIHAQLLARYFGPVPQQIAEAVRPPWGLYAGVTLLLALCGLKVAPQFRVFALSCALAMALAPLASRAFVFAYELQAFDRFGPYYFTVLAAAGMLALARYCGSWRGRAGLASAERWAGALAAIAVLSAGAVAWRNGSYELARYDFSQYPSVVEDLAYLPAYRQVREGTAKDALFLVDDGYDWSQSPRYTKKGLPIVAAFAPDGTYLLVRDDLFQLVARRRRVYTERLYGNALSNADLQKLAYLQRGTFGLPVPREEYYAALARFRPTHILWRRDRASVPRGFGRELAPPGRSAVVYEDAVCEVWELRYPEALESRVKAE